MSSDLPIHESCPCTNHAQPHGLGHARDLWGSKTRIHKIDAGWLASSRLVILRLLRPGSPRRSMTGPIPHSNSETMHGRRSTTAMFLEGSSMNRIGCGMTRVNIGERDTSSPHVGQSNLRRLTASKSEVGRSLGSLPLAPQATALLKLCRVRLSLFAPNSQCGKVDVWRGNRRITASLGPRQTTGS